MHNVIENDVNKLHICSLFLTEKLISELENKIMDQPDKNSSSRRSARLTAAQKINYKEGKVGKLISSNFFVKSQHHSSLARAEIIKISS